MTGSKKDLARRILAGYGRTFGGELGIRVERNTPSPLFRMLVFSLLASARIGFNLAVRAARALTEEGWTTPRKMAAASWRQRTDVLNRSGYARYDESTSRMLGETSSLLLDRYGGDLRDLRERSDRDAAQVRGRLKEFKGVGDVGVDIFCREVQATWAELYPFADAKALQVAAQLDLGSDAPSLARLVDRRDFPRLVAGLVRIGLERAQDRFGG